MATFKAGDRARLLNEPQETWLAGSEVTILGPLVEGRLARGGGRFSGYPVDIDGHGRLNHYGAQIYVRPEQLQPLTDPGADAFIERVKSWKPEPAPVALPEPCTARSGE